MESLSFIFEKLGPNKVTHPIEANEYEEGYMKVQSSSQPIASPPPPPPATPSCLPVLPQPAPVAPQKDTVPEQVPKLFCNLLIFRDPSMSLLSSVRIMQETDKLKEKLITAINSFDSKLCKKLDIQKENVVSDIKTEEPSSHVFAFLAYLWDALFCVNDRIVGDVKDSNTVYEVVGNDIIKVGLEQVRKNIIKKKIDNLKTVKDFKTLCSQLQLSVTKFCSVSQKQRALTKTELQAKLQAYINA